MRILLPALCLLFASCVTTKTINKKVDEDMQLGKGNTTQLFIIKRDGTKIIPASIKFPNHGALKTDNNFLWADEKKMYYREMNGFQTKDGYTAIIRHNRWKNGKTITRIRAGKINMYLGILNVDYTEYFFDKSGSDPEIITYDLFITAIADNPEAVSLFQKLFPKKKIPNDTIGGYHSSDGTHAKLTRVIDFYNQQ